MPWPDLTLLPIPGRQRGIINDNGDVLLLTTRPAWEHLHQHRSGEDAEDHRRRRLRTHRRLPYSVAGNPEGQIGGATVGQYGDPTGAVRPNVVSDV